MPEKDVPRISVIACETLRDELELAMREVGCEFQPIWLSSDYHRDPALLRSRLQEEIDRLKDVDQILLAYGCCGNGTVGLKASTAELIIPKAEDCIGIVLNKPGQNQERPLGTFFLTKGWLTGPNSFNAEIKHAVDRFGEQRAKRIIELMFKHYKQLLMIDTKAYSIPECLPEARELAETLKLELNFAEGDVWQLKTLLRGCRDQGLCYIPKGCTVTEQDFGMFVAGQQNTFTIS